MRRNRIGEVYTNKSGDEGTVVSYKGANNVDIQFNDKSISKNLKFGNIKNGYFMNKNKVSFYGVGFVGYGKYNTLTHKKYCDIWVRMLERCYSIKFLDRNTSYVGVKVCEKWHSFQVFSEWVDKYYVEGWCLDKDILSKGKKIYSPKTCCFVPQEINNLFTFRGSKRGRYPLGVSKNGNNFQALLNTGGGKQKYLGTYTTSKEAFEVYKEAKESFIKVIADKFKTKLDSRVFKAMHNYKIKNNKLKQKENGIRKKRI